MNIQSYTVLAGIKLFMWRPEIVSWKFKSKSYLVQSAKLVAIHVKGKRQTLNRRRELSRKRAWDTPGRDHNTKCLRKYRQVWVFHLTLVLRASVTQPSEGFSETGEMVSGVAVGKDLISRWSLEVVGIYEMDKQNARLSWVLDDFRMSSWSFLWLKLCTWSSWVGPTSNYREIGDRR